MIVVLALVLASAAPASAWPGPSLVLSRIASPAPIPEIKHLFAIVLENEDVDETFGPDSPAPYLGKTLPAAGAFIPDYYGIGHQSLGNYIAMVSGQSPNIATQADCQDYSEMLPGTVRADGVALGQGCVYPTAVRTIANQLENNGRSWRGYMQDMANSVAAGEPAGCRHPALGATDPTQAPRADDQYAARHNPFVYFHSIIDYSTCRRNDVDLSRLPADLASESATPDYSFITPDLCADGHDATCADGSSPGGFAGIEAFLREWVPRIQASAAYQDQGAILITFDESENGAESCCGEANGPNTPNNGGIIAPGAGGGKIGAVMLSPCIRPGTVTDTPYNHYSFLRWSEDNFDLAHLAEAGAEGLQGFGSDVFTKPTCDPALVAGEAMAKARTRLTVRPHSVASEAKRVFRFRLRSSAQSCVAGAAVRFAGRRVRTDRRGRAKITARLGHGGKRTAVARPAGCNSARARVRIRP